MNAHLGNQGWSKVTSDNGTYGESRNLEAGFLPNFSNNPYTSEIFMFLNSIRFNNGIVCRGSDQEISS